MPSIFILIMFRVCFECVIKYVFSHIYLLLSNVDSAFGKLAMQCDISFHKKHQFEKK